MGEDATAIIVAAGSGRRMGFDKLFADLGGEPVLARTLRAFHACEAVSEIIVVAAEARAGEVASLAANIGAGKVAAAIPGGAERHQSVWRGIQAASPESALLAVHDGARPLIAPEAIARCLAAAAERGAAACARPVADTMMRADAEEPGDRAR
ncbi:MAG: 2-C-methyl-D-erythritol 4-phosphate cytidylyltransferase [Verrucomicrobiales bacterium]